MEHAMWLTLLLLPAVALAVPVPDDLLEKLSADDERLEALRKTASFTETTRTEQVNPDGKTTVTEQVTRVERNERALIRVVENGNDITEKRRAKEAGEKAGKKTQQLATKLESPFAASARAKHRFELLPIDDDGAPGLIRVRFEPAGEKGRDVMFGEALVTPGGELVWMRLRPAVPPERIDSLELTQELHTVTPHGRVPSKAYADVSVSLFAIAKIRMKSVTVISDYVFPEAITVH